MGCQSSKDVVSRIQEQDKKIDDLIQINKKLEQRLADMNNDIRNDGKPANDTHDLTNLKTTIDTRFNKLEKTVEKIHNEFKLKLLEGIVDNLDEKQPGERNQDNSLSLNFEKENQGRGNANNKRNDVYKVQGNRY